MVDGYNLHNINLSDSCAHAQINFYMVEYY